MHVMPPYHDLDGDHKFPHSTSLSAQGINLPSSATLTREDIIYICEALKRAVEHQSKQVQQAPL
jgi:dTDP-4-amino-4,6-dideoxygalactose transaminase